MAGPDTNLDPYKDPAETKMQLAAPSSVQDSSLRTKLSVTILKKQLSEVKEKTEA